jgi:hypothetical protein
MLYESQGERDAAAVDVNVVSVFGSTGELALGSDDSRKTKHF